MVRLTEDIMLRSHIGRRYWRASLDDLEGKSRTFAQSYLDKFDAMRERGVGAYLWGDNSTGKTHLAVVLAKEAMRRGTPAFFLAADEIREKFIENVVFEEEVTVRQRAHDVPLLVLDDVGKENTGKSSGWVEQTIENLIRARSRNARLTILTSNLSYPDFSSRYLKSAAELVRENSIVFHVEAPRNYRAENGKEALAVLR